MAFFGVVHLDSPQKSGFFEIAHGQKARESLMSRVFSQLSTGRIRREFQMSKAAQPTVTLKHLAASLAGDHEMPKKQSEAILNDLVGLLVKHLKKGDRVRIGGGGLPRAAKSAARAGRQPPPRHPARRTASREGA